MRTSMPKARAKLGTAESASVPWTWSDEAATPPPRPSRSTVPPFQKRVRVGLAATATTLLVLYLRPPSSRYLYGHAEKRTNRGLGARSVQFRLMRAPRRPAFAPPLLPRPYLLNKMDRRCFSLRRRPPGEPDF